jgi:hypothetical protein
MHAKGFNFKDDRPAMTLPDAVRVCLIDRQVHLLSCLRLEPLRQNRRHNHYAVIQLPGRKLAGIVVQGDSAHNLLAQVSTIQKLASKYADEDLDSEIESLRDLLSEVVSHYELVCSREGIQLPYSK